MTKREKATAKDRQDADRMYAWFGQEAPAPVTLTWAQEWDARVRIY